MPGQKEGGPGPWPKESGGPSDNNGKYGLRRGDSYHHNHTQKGES